MKCIRHILIIIGIITSLFLWIFIQRANLDYNLEGKFFSTEEGVVYNEQAKMVSGIVVLIGLILIVILVIGIIKRKAVESNLSDK
ncbi:MAG: hypothetical protein L3J14_04865 [Flavobacteriaceae bacterium]|nr:hypothetical protein [Flavobacteriaceae bacterium]